MADEHLIEFVNIFLQKEHILSVLGRVELILECKFFAQEGGQNGVSFEATCCCTCASSSFLRGRFHSSRYEH